MGAVQETAAAGNRSSSDQVESDAWPSSHSMRQWRTGLERVSGMRPDEVGQRADLLLGFCRQRDMSPDDMATKCRSGAGRHQLRAAVLDAARDAGIELIVQSFLIHSGINVFADLVCMPKTDEQLAEQGSRFRRNT